jgi:hypothetical protein
MEKHNNWASAVEAIINFSSDSPLEISKKKEHATVSNPTGDGEINVSVDVLVISIRTENPELNPENPRSKSETMIGMHLLSMNDAVAAMLLNFIVSRIQAVKQPGIDKDTALQRAKESITMIGEVHDAVQAVMIQKYVSP